MYRTSVKQPDQLILLLVTYSHAHNTISPRPHLCVESVSAQRSQIIHLWEKIPSAEERNTEKPDKKVKGFISDGKGWMKI